MFVENEALEMKGKNSSTPFAIAFVSLLPFLFLGLALCFCLNSLFVSFLLSSSASLPPSPIASLFFPLHLPPFCSLQRNERNQIPLPLGLASSN